MRPKITRLDFLVKFLTREVELEDIEAVLNAYPYVYGVYQILKPFDLGPDELISATVAIDREAITVHVNDAKLAKKIKSNGSRTYTTCGPIEHEVECTTKGKFVTFEFV